MPRVRRNEWNFAANAARLISDILAEDDYSTSPLGHAEPELSEFRGARRLDIVIFQRADPLEPIITAETKVPWAADGRSPYNFSLIEAAHAKASRVGALYFITWNVRRVVVWKTDDPGVALIRRVVFDKELIPERLSSPSDLDSPAVQEGLRNGVRELVGFLHSLVTGPPAPAFLPLDRLFIATIEAALDFPIEATANAIQERMGRVSAKRDIERWMRDVQGWVVSRSTEADNIERAARFTCYVLVNRLCFYNALRRKYEQLPRLAVANNISTGERLEQRLNRAFREAERFTGNYETVFQGDFGDRIPFFADDATSAWRELIRSLDRYDFAHINVDVIGAMYEQLIKPSERHRFGQHYTKPTVVDLINSFVIGTGRETILDPACGGGTFLVRAYARKSHLDPTEDHTQLLEAIYGCDVLNYACHLSIINLAIRDLIDDDNFPRIHTGDFLRFVPGETFSTQPVRIQAGGLISETRNIVVNEGQFDAVIGNPPYIQAREMSAEDRAVYYDQAVDEWPDYSWRRSSDIYAYFWTHAARLLTNNGYLALLTQAAWLDVDYGVPLQEWMLDQFRIIAILETEAEPWFTGARVATAVTVLQREHGEARRRNNTVRFVQFRKRLSEVLGDYSVEQDRQTASEQLRDAILAESSDAENNNYRIRTISQRELEQLGVNEEGAYVGSKWGRYLRATSTLYRLQRQHSDRFVPLSRLASIQRGTTTNCDAFFLVKNVSAEALGSIHNAQQFRERYGVSRNQVADGHISIIRRRDNVAFALESRYLVPILRTARDYSWFNTAHVGSDYFAISIPENRAAVSRLAETYIRAGERERWHLSPSFRSVEGNWYTLRNATQIAPILFIKTMQYTPLVLLNDDGLLANQRLYNVHPHQGINELALSAVLNSTLFACERYAAVKALGREAAIDVEVFSARAFLTADITRYTDTMIGRLEETMRQLTQREVGPLLEEVLIHAGHAEAKAYIEHNSVNSGVWPAELRDETRQQLDRLVLSGLGVDESDIPQIQEGLYNDLTEHVRKLRLLELEAQINRRGASVGTDPSPRQLADEIWAQLIETETIQPRAIPDDFVDNSTELLSIHIPVGRVSVGSRSLFDQGRFFCLVGRTRVEFDTEDQMKYATFLANLGIAGTMEIPFDDDVCQTALQQMTQYLDEVTEVFSAAAAEITGEGELQRRIVREGIRRITRT